MNFTAEGPGWKAEILVAGETAAAPFLHFYVQCDADSERLCWAVMDDVIPIFMGGREVFWRVRPEIEQWKDFESEKSGWKGFARFTAKTIATIEHDIYRPKDGTEVVFMGFGKKEGA